MRVFSSIRKSLRRHESKKIINTNLDHGQQINKQELERWDKVVAAPPRNADNLWHLIARLIHARH